MLNSAVFRALTQADTLTASRALSHLESLGLLQRSAGGRGYTLVREKGAAYHVTPHITPQVAEELPRLLAAGRRLSRDEMTDLIVALCAARPYTARELAQRLGRSAKYLRDAYLSSLVRQGRLQLTGAPNDPNVAYFAP